MAVLLSLGPRGEEVVMVGTEAGKEGSALYATEHIACQLLNQR